MQKILTSNMHVLLAASSDEMTRMESAGLLAEIGVPAVPHLVEALYSESHDVIKYAAGTLGVIGPDARGALPTLIVMMKDEHPLRRRSALALIGYIGPDAYEAIDELMPFLGDPDPLICGRAVESLGRIGPRALIAAPRIHTLMRHKDWGVRARAIESLEKMCALTPEVIQNIYRARLDPHPSVRKTALDTLTRIAPPLSTLPSKGPWGTIS